MTYAMTLLLLTSILTAGNRAGQAPESGPESKGPDIRVETRFVQVDPAKLRLVIEGYSPPGPSGAPPFVETNVIHAIPSDAMRDRAVDLSRAREFGAVLTTESGENPPRFEGVVLNGRVEFREGLRPIAWKKQQQLLGPGAVAEAPDGMKTLLAPTLLIPSGKRAALSSGVERAYLEDVGGGCLRLQWMESTDDDLILSPAEGTAFEAAATLQDDGMIRFDPMIFVYRRMTGREPIEGIPFDVGKPIIRSQKMSISLVMKQNATAVFALPRSTKAEPLILALVTAAEFKPKSDADPQGADAKPQDGR